LRRTPILEVEAAEWDYLHAVNLRGAFVVAQATARHMVARGGGGRIVIVSSVNQQTVNRGLVHYAATKGGLMQLAKGLALELAEHRITVNLIAPGTIETDLNRAALADPENRRRRLPTIPAGRFGQPEDIVAAALYLVGDGAAYVTGSTITVDGGLTIE
jgi:NAD(P)-dependent dehydrogenase (short-subunit alcohol dehydrogenase family)